jgi:hypothetical protein
MDIAIARGGVILGTVELEFGREKIDAAEVRSIANKIDKCRRTYYNTMEYRQKTA